MAIIGVTELDLEGKRDYFKSSAEGEVGFRTFLVQSNDPVNDLEPQILSASHGGVSIPAPFSQFPGSTNCLCIKLHPVRNRKLQRFWEVRADYKSIIDHNELERGNNPNPLDRKTAISGQSRTIMVPRLRLLRTFPYKLWSNDKEFQLGGAVNSATDPLDPPIDVAQTEWEIHCEKNVDVFPDWFLADSYANGVNAADQNITILGTTRTIKAGTGKLSNFTFSEPRKENGKAYIRIGWNVTVRWYRPLFGDETDRFGPWDEERLDAGKRTYSTIAGRWINIRDNTGQSVDLPVPLDGSGEPINTTGARIPQSSLWWIAYRPFGDRVNFSVLPWV